MDDREGPYRPTLVRMIASMEALACLGLVLFGIVLVALSDLIPKGDLTISSMGKDKLVIYGYSAIVLGVLAFLVAAGVWSLSNTGRKIAIGAMVAGIFVPIFVIGLLGQVTFFFNLIVYPLVIYYLMMDDTKQHYK